MVGLAGKALLFVVVEVPSGSSLSLFRHPPAKAVILSTAAPPTGRPSWPSDKVASPHGVRPASRVLDMVDDKDITVHALGQFAWARGKDCEDEIKVLRQAAV